MLILPPDADEELVGRVRERITQVVGERDGEITKLDVWGKRRLAYELGRLSEGFYVLAECTADPAAIKELDRILSLADEVVRFKVVVRAA